MELVSLPANCHIDPDLTLDVINYSLLSIVANWLNFLYLIICNYTLEWNYQHEIIYRFLV